MTNTPMRWLPGLLLSAALLAGCAAPAAQGQAADPVPAAQPAPHAALPAPAPAPALPPIAKKPKPGAGGPAAVSRACKVDADCAVKDVGSCCGRFPACVATDARPDPAAVQAQCARSGMASVCGFREVSGCSCVAGTCQDSGSGAQLR